ncbi:MAG: hypothetical protein OXL34_09355 [Gemmatimonadota bacterium]|nr:hypothetical protein [Gemmatimonadota bacterium]
MADKIDEEERRSMAHAEVAEALAGDTLETEFLRLEAGSDDAGVDDRLTALKAEMGLLPAGSPEAPRQLGSGEDDEEEADDGSDGTDAAPAEEAPIREAELLEEFEKLENEEGTGARP